MNLGQWDCIPITWYPKTISAYIYQFFNLSSKLTAGALLIRSRDILSNRFTEQSFLLVHEKEVKREGKGPFSTTPDILDRKRG